MARLNIFWHKVQRWTTNSFSATPTGILSVESCLSAVLHLISLRQRIAALRAICSRPAVNPVTARLEASFPSLSAHSAKDSARALTRGLKSVYLPLNWKSPQHVPPITNHLPIDAVAYKTIPFTQGLSWMSMVNSHLASPALAIPPQSLMNNTYPARKQRVREALLEEWSRLFLTLGYYQHSSTFSPVLLMGLDKIIAGPIYQMRAGKRYVAPHPTWSPRCRHLLPLLWSRTQNHSNTASSPACPDRALTQASSTVSPVLVKMLTSALLSHNSKGSQPESAEPPPDSPNDLSTEHALFFPPFTAFTSGSAPPRVLCFLLAELLACWIFFPATTCELSLLDN